MSGPAGPAGLCCREAADAHCKVLRAPVCSSKLDDKDRTTAAAAARRPCRRPLRTWRHRRPAKSFLGRQQGMPSAHPRAAAKRRDAGEQPHPTPTPPRPRRRSDRSFKTATAVWGKGVGRVRGKAAFNADYTPVTLPHAAAPPRPQPTATPLRPPRPLVLCRLLRSRRRAPTLGSVQDPASRRPACWPKRKIKNYSNNFRNSSEFRLPPSF